MKKAPEDEDSTEVNQKEFSQYLHNKLEAPYSPIIETKKLNIN
jgi:hypothetical protein